MQRISGRGCCGQRRQSRHPNLHPGVYAPKRATLRDYLPEISAHELVLCEVVHTNHNKDLTCNIRDWALFQSGQSHFNSS